MKKTPTQKRIEQVNLGSGMTHSVYDRPLNEANHISNLTDARDKAHAKIEKAQKEISDFVAFLHSAKFTGSESGERKDWISTGDVTRRLQDLRDILSEQ